MVEVRPYADASPEQTEQLRDVFARASEDSPAGELWGDLASEAAIYLDPYVEHEPRSLLLALVDGAVVGYLAGCLDASAFPSESALFDAAMREHRLFQRRDTRPFFVRAMRDSLGARLRGRPTASALDDPRWPSHLHIDLVPQARGHGIGDALMDAWASRLADHGSPGCYLQTQVENPRAVRFFERHGYVAWGETALIPGVRVQGSRSVQVTMVNPAPS